MAGNTVYSIHLGDYLGAQFLLDRRETLCQWGQHTNKRQEQMRWFRSVEICSSKQAAVGVGNPSGVHPVHQHILDLPVATKSRKRMKKAVLDKFEGDSFSRIWRGMEKRTQLKGV